MTAPSGPSQNAEPLAPVSNAQDPPQPVPSFVHVLPCTNPPVKYLDLDGCATGIHVTREDIQDLYVLYGKMADTIKAKDQSLEQTSPDPCAVCKDPIKQGPTSPVLYMENCAHYFHYGCLVGRPRLFAKTLDCPRCKVSSSRALLRPQVFPTAAAKNELFQLQKRSFGLDVAPQTVLQVKKCYMDNDGFPAFDLYVNDDHLTVRKRPPPGTWHCNERPSNYSMREPTGGSCCGAPRNVKVTEEYLVQVIQRLHLADQSRAFYLGDILPLEENVQYQAKYGLKPPLGELRKREKVLFQFRCPFVRLEGSNGEQCSQGRDCEFWHGWPKKTQKFIQEQVKFRDFPRFYCQQNSRTPYMKCIERIRMNSQELVRCSAGFHPSTQNLKDIGRFAHKMAKQIMAPVVVPEQPLTCAFCHKTPEPNSVWIHMQNCVHWLHVNCIPLVRRVNSNRKLELHCPTCLAPSVRTIAWPGPFPSDMAKQTIFTRQLAEFKLAVQADTKLVIVEAASQIFILDYVGSDVVKIDVTTAVQDIEGTTIWYD